MSLKSTVFTLTGLQMISKVTEIVYHIIVAYWIGAFGRGETALAFLFVDMLVLLFSVSSDDAMVLLLGKRKISVSQAWGTSLGFTAVTTALCGIAGGVVMAMAPAFLAKIQPGLLLLAMTAIPFKVLLSHQQQMLLGLQRTTQAGALSLILSVANLVCVGLLCIAVHSRGVESVILARTMCCLVCVAIAGVWLWRDTCWSQIWPTWRGVGETLSIGCRQYGSRLAIQMENRLDQFLIVYFVPGLAMLGCYAQGVALAERLAIFSMIVHLAVLPVACASDDGAAETIAKGSRMSVLLTGFSAGILAIFCPVIVRLLFGPEFSPSVWVIWLILPGIVMRSVTRMMCAYMLSINRPGINSWVILGGLVVNIAMNMVLIPRWGINGASVASSISYSIEALALAYWFSRLTSVGIGRVIVPGRGDYKYLLDICRRNMSGFFV
jgi:O-antigen/teichoic acid export membrane protein